jgi:hypothetical protein
MHRSHRLELPLASLALAASFAFGLACSGGSSSPTDDHAADGGGIDDAAGEGDASATGDGATASDASTHDASNANDAAPPHDAAAQDSASHGGDASCTPFCGSMACGDDGCGGSCGSCPASYTCVINGTCQLNPGSQCGNATCGSAASCCHCNGQPICYALMPHMTCADLGAGCN